MKKLANLLLYGVAFMSLIFTSGCFGATNIPVNPGDVLPVHPSTALKIIQDAATAAPGTSMFVDPTGKRFMFVKAMADNGFGFVLLDGKQEQPIQAFKNAGLQGNFTSIEDMKGLIKFMKDSGWKLMTPAELPAVIRIGISSAGGWINAAANSLTTIIVLPTGIFINTPGMPVQEVE